LTFNNKTIWPDGFDPPISKAVEAQDEDFAISFHPTLSPQQIKTALEALADYFRKCGGAGLRIDFEFETISARDPEHAGR
jgi:hypothetical protein